MMVKTLAIEDIQVGDSASVAKVFTAKDVQEFAEISGDSNPLHVDEVYAASTIFGKPIVHGILLSSLFSRLVGTELPGKKCLYVHQTLSFKKPVFLDEEVKATVTVEAISHATRILSLDTVIEKEGVVVVSGKAHVQVLE